jgi:uncharacterized protein with HEPN domain
MTDKDPLLYVDHMPECIARIAEYTEGGAAAFMQSRLIQDAVVRNLQVMAESSQRLPETIKSAYPDVPWRDISGFRNILVHDYLGIDLNLVWSVVENDLPILRRALEKLAP